MHPTSHIHGSHVRTRRVRCRDFCVSDGFALSLSHFTDKLDLGYLFVAVVDSRGISDDFDVTFSAVVLPCTTMYSDAQ